MNLVDTSPLGGYIRSLKGADWSVAGAISELIDNSLGAGRGDAQNVWITTQKKGGRTYLTILDDGRGMDSIDRMFQLGNTTGRSPGDIGEYGSGGTMAIHWLPESVSVWTMRDGKVASASADWNVQIRRNEFPKVDVDWYPAVSGSAPQELLRIGHGTMIQMVLSSSRDLKPSNVVRQLAKNYAPALRNGRRIYWNGAEPVAEAVVKIPNPRQIAVMVELDGTVYTASGEIGFVLDLPIAQSEVAVSFGHRVIMPTRDCYRSPEGRPYSGVGVTGHVDLHDGWQPLLTTTKNGIADARARNLLMSRIYEQIKDLLDEAERSRRTLRFEDMRLDLQSMLNMKDNATPDDGGKLVPNLEGDEEMYVNQPGPGPDKPGSSTPVKAKRVDFRGVQLDITEATDSDLEGALVRFDVEGNTLLGWYNIEQEFSRNAFNDLNRNTFYAIAIGGISDCLQNGGTRLLPKIFNTATRQRVESLDRHLRGSLIERLLLERIKG